MRAAFFTLGCKVNQYETAVLMQKFAASGYDIVEPEQDADVYIINSCTVTAEGDRKTRQILRRFKRQNPSAVICLTGCFPQAFPDAAERIPEADVITGSKNRAGLLEAVASRLAGGQRVIDIQPHAKGDRFEAMRLEGSVRTRAFVKIQDGCERYCAYCIIPTARGPVRSKPLDKLKSELEDLVESGYREIVLVGINLSTYGTDLGYTLLDALRMACSIPNLPRVRLGSLEPELMPSETIAEMASLPTLCPQFHLSLQSGCDATLKRMRRHYTTADYRRIVTELRAAFPNCAITTDIMVGFPGETDEEFSQSLAFAQEIAFAQAHVFAYSIRPGTLAAKMPNQITRQVKSERAAKMSATTLQTRRDFLAAQTGGESAVLFEVSSTNLREGYTENYTPVNVYSEQDLSGKIHRVRLDSVKDDHCTGELLL